MRFIHQPVQPARSVEQRVFRVQMKMDEVCVRHASTLPSTPRIAQGNTRVSQSGFSLLFPIGPKQLEFAAKFPVDALLLRPKRIAVARLNQERIAETLVQSGLDLIRDVSVAFAEARLQRIRLRYAEELKDLTARIEDLVSAQVRAGAISQLAAATSKIDAARASMDSERARRQLEIAEARVRTLVGISGKAEPIELVESPEPSFEAFELLGLLGEAFAARPDIRAAEIAVEAASKKVQLSRLELLAVTGVLDVNAGNGEFQAGPGIEFPIPIFNQNQGGTALENANLNQALRHLASVRERVRLEVAQAEARHREATQVLSQWRSTLVPELEYSLRRSERALESGELSLLDILLVRRELTSARIAEAEAEAQYDRACAELERSVGRNLKQPSRTPSASLNQKP